jgi:glutathione S-transferase
MALKEKGVAFEMIDSQPHTQLQNELHPFGKVPAFRHGEFTLFETTAIMRYMNEAFDGPPLQPETTSERAVMDQWMSAVNDVYYDAMIRRLVLERLAPMIFERDSDEQKIKSALPDIEHQLDVLDSRFEVSAYLANENVSLADILLIPIVFTVAMTPGGDDFVNNLPNLARWQKGMAGRTSLIETMPPFSWDSPFE